MNININLFVSITPMSNKGKKMNSAIESAWALAWLGIVLALVAGSRRLGRNRAAAWLVVVGLFLLAIEEPALTVWLGVTGPNGDPDGMATLVTPLARAHVLDASIYGAAAAVMLGGIALTSFKRGERWARRALTWGLAVVALTEATTTLLVFSRGLAVPGAAGAAGGRAFGWQPVAVGLAAWATGLWLGAFPAARRRTSSPDVAPARN